MHVLAALTCCSRQISCTDPGAGWQPQAGRRRTCPLKKWWRNRANAFVYEATSFRETWDPPSRGKGRVWKSQAAPNSVPGTGGHWVSCANQLTLERALMHCPFWVLVPLRIPLIRKGDGRRMVIQLLRTHLCKRIFLFTKPALRNQGNEILVMEEAERTREQLQHRIMEWEALHRWHVILQQGEKTYSKDGPGRFQHWDNTWNPGVKRPFSCGRLFCKDESWKTHIRHPPRQQTLEQGLWQHRKKRCPPAKAFSQTCQSPVQTLLLLGWEMFSCRAQLHASSPAPWCSQCSPSGTLLQDMEGIALQLLTFQKCPANTELFHAKENLSPAVFCDKRVAWTRSPGKSL